MRKNGHLMFGLVEINQSQLLFSSCQPPPMAKQKVQRQGIQTLVIEHRPTNAYRCERRTALVHNKPLTHTHIYRSMPVALFLRAGKGRSTPLWPRSCIRNLRLRSISAQLLERSHALRHVPRHLPFAHALSFLWETRIKMYQHVKPLISSTISTRSASAPWKRFTC